MRRTLSSPAAGPVSGTSLRSCNEEVHAEQPTTPTIERTSARLPHDFANAATLVPWSLGRLRRTADVALAFEPALDLHLELLRLAADAGKHGGALQHRQGLVGEFARRGRVGALRGISGRAQSAVRPISPEDFNRIFELGFEEKAPLLPRLDNDVPSSSFDEEQTPFKFDQQRDRISVTISKIFRDRVFGRVVLRAYDERCAITGLKLINGSGRAEVAAAHIRPVEANGPDIVSNGIALSGTAHWMFDRGLISLADDLEISISRQTNDPQGLGSIIK